MIVSLLKNRLLLIDNSLAVFLWCVDLLLALRLAIFDFATGTFRQSVGTYSFASNGQEANEQGHFSKLHCGLIGTFGFSGLATFDS